VTEEQHLKEEPDMITRLLGYFLSANVECAGFTKNLHLLNTKDGISII